MHLKKILFVLPRLHTNILPLISALKQNGIVVKVLAFYTFKGKHSEDHENVDIDIVGFSKLVNILPRAQRLRFGIPSIKCLTMILQNKPDLVVVREFLPSASFIHLFCKLFSIRTVMYTQKPIYGWKPTFSRQIFQKIFFPKKVYTTSLGNIENKKVSIQNHKWGKKWSYIPFVAEINLHAKQRSYFKNNQVNILLVGKFTKRKMILEFLEVFNILSKERDDLCLTLAGTVLDQNILEKAKEFINDNNLPVNIKIAVPPNKMSELYLENDIFVLPAIREPASVSQLEAMCHGLAILCSNDNGTAYYVQPGRNGDVFDVRNFNQDLENKMRRILSNRENIQKLGQESINIVEENHSPDKFISFIENIID
jgi:glycosyltransferase involved in cell wall biosynthesis